MGSVLFADKGRPSKIERLADGSIRVVARIARDGVQNYAPWPQAKIQGRPIKVYRPKSEVFKDSSLATLKGTAVTVGHPPEREVNPASWKKYAVGHNEGEPKIVKGDDGREYIETPIVVSDGPTIDSVKGKDLVELSQGYGVDLDWTPGTTDDGETYDVVQRDIMHNHTALLGVGQARAGGGARVLLDSSEPARSKKKMDENEKKEFAAQVVKATLDAIDARDQSKADAKAREEKIAADAKAEAKKEFEANQFKKGGGKKGKKPEDEEEEEEEEGAKDKKGGKGGKPNDSDEPKTDREKAAAEAKAMLDAKDDTAKTKILTDAKDDAKAMLPDDYEFEGKTAREIHVDSIERHLPDYKIDGKSDDQLAGAFDALKASETKYVAGDSTPSRGSNNGVPAHVKEYNERMGSVFGDSWEK